MFRGRRVFYVVMVNSDIYRVFQKEIYNFEIVYKFIQKICTVL
jgi:hypothetical protein